MTQHSHRHWPLYLAWIVYGSLFTLVVLGWSLYAARQTSVLGYAYRYDFLNVYIGAKAVLAGQGTQLYDLTLQRQLTTAAIAPYTRSLLLPYTYPGYVAVALAPLAALPYGTAFVLWGGCNLLAAGWAVARLVLTTARGSGEGVALFFASASFMPLLLGLLHGQFQLLPLLGLVETVIALRAGRQGQAGAWLLLGLIKPHLILLPLMALLLWRCRRLLTVFSLGLLGLMVLSFTVLGNWLPSYIALLAEFTRQGVTLGNYPSAMHNWRALVYTLLGTNSSSPALGLLLLLDIFSVGLLVVVCRRSNRPNRSPRQLTPAVAAWEIPFALAILLGLLVSPHLYLHDAVLALPAGFILWRANPRPVLQWLLGAGPAVAFIVQFWPEQITPIQPGPIYITLLIAVVIVTRRDLLQGQSLIHQQV